MSGRGRGTPLTVLHNGRPGSRFDAAAAVAREPLMGRLSCAISIHENAISTKANGGILAGCALNCIKREEDECEVVGESYVQGDVVVGKKVALSMFHWLVDRSKR